ncbi:MAG: YbhN family protein, partial [Acidimicrobiia bacterium]
MDDRDDAPSPTGDAPDAAAAPASTSRMPTWLRITARLLLWPAVISALVIPQLPRFREATIELQSISLPRLLVGFALVTASIACYSGLTRTALLERSDRIPHVRMFRIQLATRALANVVPGGNATASALGFRLITQAGASNTGAAFALATAGLYSAFVLNVLFWAALLASLPSQGADWALAATAAAGLLLLLGIGVVAFAVTRRDGRLHRLAVRIAGRLRIEPGRISDLLVEIRQRFDTLRRQPALLRRLTMWSLLQWSLDMAALWTFLAAFGIRLDPIVLVLVFGAANIAAAVPITPGGLGVVEGVYITALVQLGFTLQAAALGVAAYRLAHYLFPILTGGLAYLSLRAGPWRLG